MSAPPASSSLAVLLFTDVVGSTDLKARLSSAVYARMLARHNALFEGALAAFPGARIVKHTGDGYFAIFATASDATACALAFQHAMRREKWTPEPLTTRVGIHVGEVARVQVAGLEDVMGLAADVAARVMSLAVGGQILATRPAYEDARQFLTHHPEHADSTKTPALRWLNHGFYLFKGTREPLEIFEVGAERLSPFKAPPDGEKATRVEPVPRGARKRRLALAAIILTLVLLGKVWLEGTAFGATVDGFFHRQLQQHLLAAPPALAGRALVADITKLRPAPAPGQPDDLVTPRDKLLALVRAIAAERPAAIGIDIDFSPENDQPVDPADPEFLEACRQLGEGVNPVPVFVGVYRTCHQPAAKWLGEARFAPLAASITLPANAWWGIESQWSLGSEGLPSLAVRLGRALGAKRLRLPGAVEWLATDYRLAEFPNRTRAHKFLIDLTPLPALRSAHTVAVRSPEEWQARTPGVAGRIVVLGDDADGASGDVSNIPGAEELVPRVYLHTCVALTFAHAPIYLPSGVGRVLLDAALISVVLAIALLGRRWWILRLLAAAVALAAGAAFVHFTRVMWTDFIVIALPVALPYYYSAPRLPTR
jgi:class 3 adenylate cyclase